MKKLPLLIGLLSFAAATLAGNLSIPGNGAIPSATAAEVEWGGELEVTGNLNLSTSGKALVFPDATRQTSAPPSYVRTVIVSPVGNSLQNGTELLEKRAAITDASATKPYLLKIEPGVYDIGTNSLVMGEYIDIEGAGPGATTITGGGGGMVATVVGASNAEIRDLSVNNLGTGSWSRAIYNSHSLRITNVEASARGATSNTAIENSSGSAPLISHVSAWAEGGSSSYGIYNWLCSASLYYVRADATNATDNNYGIYSLEMTSLIIENSTARGQTGETAIGVYIFNTMSASLINLTAEASGTNGYGIVSDNSSSLMREITASASGGTNSYGIFMSGDSVLINVIAKAWSSSNCKGIQNSGGSPVMMNVVATARDGTTSNYGLHNPFGSGTIVSDRCTFKGATRSVSAIAGLVLKIGGSKLDGVVDSAGSWTCVNCYDGNGSALNAVCQH